MKKLVVVLLMILFAVNVYSQEKMFIHKQSTTPVELLVSSIDSIYFSQDSTNIFFRMGATIEQYLISEIDSITFSANTVFITYNGTSASVINPFANAGVTVVVVGSQVVVSTSATVAQDINYSISGTSANGYLKLYSEKRFNLLLNNLNLTNLTGPAINIQSSKKANVVLVDGTNNTLTDGLNYNDAFPITEDQKAAFFSEGQMIFSGNGNLTINGIGIDKHALASDDYLEINSGNININSAKKDGIHVKEGVIISGGNINITSSGDGIDGDVSYINISGGNIIISDTATDAKGINCDSILTITGGNINIASKGLQSKGIKSGKDMALLGGRINITTTGNAVLTASGSGFIPSYCAAIKCDSNILINGSNITINSSGLGAKGISSDKDIIILSDSVKITSTGSGVTYTNALGIADAYTSSCISTDGNLNLSGGNITLSNSGNGGKGLDSDGEINIGNSVNNLNLKVTTTGQRILISGTTGSAAALYANPKAIKSNNNLTVNNGNIIINTSYPGGDAFDCDSNITINGGTIGITIAGNQTKGIKSSGNMYLKGGNITVNTTGGVVLETSGSGNIPSYTAAIKSSRNIFIDGATINTTGSGSASKGITSDANITMTSGNVTVSCTGTGTKYTNSLGTLDSYNSTCMGADGRIIVLGGSFTSTTATTAAGGKAFSANGSIIIGDANNSPVINLTTSGAKFVVSGTNYCHPKTIVSDSNVTINNGTINLTSTDDGIHAEKIYTQNGGNVTITNSYEGVEGFNIIVNGGNLNISSTNDGINATAGLVSGGTESNDGSLFSVTGGTVISGASSGDAIDANGSIIISGGLIIANGPMSGMEEACDFNGSFNMNGGLFIGAGSNSNMTKAMSATSAQPNMYIKSSTVIPSTSLLHIENASAVDVITFKPKNGGYYFLFSSSALVQGATYNIYTGGSYTGGSVNNGYYTGGSYTAGTLKKTVVLSTTSKVNTITF